MKNYALYFFFLCSFLMSEPKEHQSLMATLFVQNSAESYTNSLSIYKAAEDQLEKVVENTQVSAAIEQTEGFSGKPPAVILDVDQTVLDNIAYQARLIETNTYYPQGWKEWCEEEQADYMPGVESFLNKASELGIEVFFITNRDVNVEQATKNNLEKLGFKFTKNLDQLLMKNEEPNWGSNKNSRRSLLNTATSSIKRSVTEKEIEKEKGGTTCALPRLYELTYWIWIKIFYCCVCYFLFEFVWLQS